MTNRSVFNTETCITNSNCNKHNKFVIKGKAAEPENSKNKNGSG